MGQPTFPSKMEPLLWMEQLGSLLSMWKALSQSAASTSAVSVDSANSRPAFKSVIALKKEITHSINVGLHNYDLTT